MTEGTQYIPYRPKRTVPTIRGVPGLSHLFYAAPPAGSRPNSSMDIAAMGKDHAREGTGLTGTGARSIPRIEHLYSSPTGWGEGYDRDRPDNGVGSTNHMARSANGGCKYPPQKAAARTYNLKYLQSYLETGHVPSSSESSESDSSSFDTDSSPDAGTESDDEAESESSGLNAVSDPPHDQLYG
ncbi:hypothetical protein EV182_008392, partial [Spiromyces aspiralis]